MRPTPAELVNGAVRVLRNDVRSSVESARATQLLDHATVSLKQVNWDDATFGLLEETQAIAHLLAQTQSTLWHAVSAEAQDAIIAALETARPELNNTFELSDLRFASIESRNRTCRHALSALIAGVGWWSSVLPPQGEDLRAKLVEHMRRFSGGGYWRPLDPQRIAPGTSNEPTRATGPGGAH